MKIKPAYDAMLAYLDEGVEPDYVGDKVLCAALLNVSPTGMGFKFPGDIADWNSMEWDWINTMTQFQKSVKNEFVRICLDEMEKN